MDEQMIELRDAIADALKPYVNSIAIACERGWGNRGAEEVAEHLARAAHSVIAGKVAELEAENARLSGAVCSGVLGELLTPDENAALVAFVKDLRRAALAPHPKGKADAAD